MQNQQQMAGMANMNAGGPVAGTPIMGNGQRRQPLQDGPRDRLNTYIYDYFLRNNHPRMARAMLECDIKIDLLEKASPHNTNGVDAMDPDSKDDLPRPEIPQGQVSDNSFLMDWWVQFWEIYNAARGTNNKTTAYTSHVRNFTHMSNEQRNHRMMMAGAGMGGMNPQQYNMMRMQQQQNGVPNDLKRAAAMHGRNPNQAAAMANMSQMQKQQAIMGAQMQRDGSQMEGRPPSPGSNENAPSPNKRPRVDGGMNQGNGPNQFNDFAQGVQQKSIEGMNAGHQGSPMPQATGLDGSDMIITGNQPRTGMNNGQPGPPPGNHALQDYQMQLMLLEQQNKKRLLMARQEQDSMSGPHAPGGVGGPAGFPAAMSPQGGSRAGPSPNPADMKKGTPRMVPSGLPSGGSPMPEGMMQQPQRNSPAPNMPYDPNGPPQGFPHQYTGLPGQMPNTPMMRGNPSSHPNFNGQQMNPQQMEAMRANGMQNGAWRGPPGQPGMMPNQPQMGGPMGGQPQQQQRGQMPPPPAPAGEQTRAQVPSPSQPAQAPPTPSQSNKANPKKKTTKDTKPATKKGATGATPAASGAEEPPTPTTPMHKNFGPNGQQQPPQASAQPQQPAPQQQQQQPPSMDSNAGPPFGNINDDTTNFDLNLGFGDDPSSSLDQFDFESFLHVGGDDSNTFGGLDFGSGFDAVETDLN